MTTYRVVWCIDIEADSYREAAEQALAIQRDPTSSATVFEVEDIDVRVSSRTVPRYVEIDTLEN